MRHDCETLWRTPAPHRPHCERHSSEEHRMGLTLEWGRTDGIGATLHRGRGYVGGYNDSISWKAKPGPDGRIKELCCRVTRLVFLQQRVATRSISTSPLSATQRQAGLPPLSAFIRPIAAGRHRAGGWVPGLLATPCRAVYTIADKGRLSRAWPCPGRPCSGRPRRLVVAGRSQAAIALGWLSERRVGMQPTPRPSRGLDRLPALPCPCHRRRPTTDHGGSKAAY